MKPCGSQLFEHRL